MSFTYYDFIHGHIIGAFWAHYSGVPAQSKSIREINEYVKDARRDYTAKDWRLARIELENEGYLEVGKDLRMRLTDKGLRQMKIDQAEQEHRDAKRYSYWPSSK